MRVTGLHIDRFGVWSNLKMDGLNDGMTVFYGPNEAGKSTLMQYIRAVLYGFHPERCERFVKGRRSVDSGTLIKEDGPLGGSLFVADRAGGWHVRRLADVTDPLGMPGEISVAGPDGQREGAQRLNSLLSGIDEPIFNNVFAVGLREMQALGALDDTDAARQLYSLSTGTDRVSLVDVTRKLQQTRCRLVGCNDEASLLGDLVAQQDRCRNAIAQMSSQSDRWASLVAERDAIEEEIARLESGRSKTNARMQLARVALQVHPKWEELRNIDRRLESMSSVPRIDPRVFESLRSAAQDMEVQEKRIEDCKLRRELLREQVQQLKRRESVGRHSSRILAMLDQRRDIGTLDARVVQLQNELNETESEILAEQERLGLRWDSRTGSTTNVLPDTGSRTAMDSIEELERSDLAQENLSQTNLSKAERKRRRKNKPRRTGARTVGAQSVSDGDYDDPLSPRDEHGAAVRRDAAGRVIREQPAHGQSHEDLNDPRRRSAQNSARGSDGRRPDGRTQPRRLTDPPNAAGTEILPLFDSAMIAALQEPAVSLDRERQMLETTKKEATRYREEARLIERQIATALGHDADWCENRDDDDILRALEQTTDLTTALRRQVGLQKDLGELESELAEIEDRRAAVLSNQLLPWDLVKALGALFTVGAGLVFCGLFGGTFGWNDSQRGVLLIMGVISSTVAAVLKFTLDSPARDGLRDSNLRNERLRESLEQLQNERESLEEKLSAHKVASTDLRESETRLIQLEALLPLERQRRGTLDLAEQANQRAVEIAKNMKHTRARWEHSLESLGLSTRMTPEQMRALSGRSGNLVSLHRIREERKTSLAEARQEQQRIGERVRDLLADALIPPVGDRPTDHLNQLAEALKLQSEQDRQLEQSKQEEQRVRREQQNATSRFSQLQRNRRSLIASAGALDESDLERKRLERVQYDELRERRETVQRAIDKIQSKLAHKQNDQLRRELERDDAVDLPTRVARAEADLTQSDARLKELQYRSGEIAEQIKQLAADRSLGRTQLELGNLQYHVDRGVEKWKTVSTIAGLLRGVYSKYEKDRQPDTLKDASRHLVKMTNGRYTRVWTPLAEDALLVDDADGNASPIEMLSRGTREQLFLSLRLALISCYARRNVKMPVILDDVLVNFDAERTEAAASVLADFARSGHQLLVFTCHEHIRELFEGFQVDVRDLPSNGSRTKKVTVPAEVPKATPTVPAPVVVEPPLVPAAASVPPVVPPMVSPAVTGVPVLGFTDDAVYEQPFIAREASVPGFPPEVPAEYIAEWHGDSIAAQEPMTAPLIGHTGAADADLMQVIGGPFNWDAIEHADANPTVSAALLGTTTGVAVTAAAVEPFAFPDDLFQSPPTRAREAFSSEPLSLGGATTRSQHEFATFFDSPPTRSTSFVPPSTPHEKHSAVSEPEWFADSEYTTPPRRMDATFEPPSISKDVEVRTEFTSPQKPLVKVDLDPPYQSAVELTNSEDVGKVSSSARKTITRENPPTHAVKNRKKSQQKKSVVERVIEEKTSIPDRKRATKKAATFVSPVNQQVRTEKPKLDLPKTDNRKTRSSAIDGRTSKAPAVQTGLEPKYGGKPGKRETREKGKGLLKAGFLASHQSLLQPGFVTRAVAKTTGNPPPQPGFSDSVQNFIADNPIRPATRDATTEDIMLDSIHPEDPSDTKQSDYLTDELKTNQVEVDEVDSDDEYEYVDVEDSDGEDEYEYVEVDVDEDGNEIEAEGEEAEGDDEYEFVEVDSDEAEDEEYEYVEVEVDEDGNEIEAEGEEAEEEDEYEYVEVDEAEDGEDDEYEYVEVDVDEDGNEIEAEAEEDDEYEYVEVDEAEEGEDDEYEYVEVDEEEDSEVATESASGGLLATFEEVKGALKEKAQDVVDDLLDDHAA